MSSFKINTQEVLKEERKELLSKSSVINKIGDYEIFKHYIGDFKIGKAFNSPLREDKNPSFAIFIDSKTKDLLYKDMASGDCGDVIKFVRKLYNIGYKDALVKIEDDLKLDIARPRINNQYRNATITNFSIKRKKFLRNDLAYWKQYEIQEETLKKFNVFAISKYFVNDIPRGTYTEDNPMYAYKVFNKFKIYKPLGSKSDKWRGNLSSLDIFGYEQLPENGKTLIITKSLKDVMSFYELGIPAISPPSESTIIRKEIIEKLKQRFETIISFYDRDKTGMIFARKLYKTYGIKPYFIHKRFKKKDVSDLIKEIGIEKTNQYIKSLLGEMI